MSVQYTASLIQYLFQNKFKMLEDSPYCVDTFCWVEFSDTQLFHYNWKPWKTGNDHDHLCSPLVITCLLTASYEILQEVHSLALRLRGTNVVYPVMHLMECNCESKLAGEVSRGVRGIISWPERGLHVLECAAGRGWIEVGEHFAASRPTFARRSTISLFSFCLLILEIRSSLKSPLP